MSCVVAMTNGKTVWMGGDSAVTDNETVTIVNNRKVVLVGDILLGHVGGLRPGQVIEHTKSLQRKRGNKPVDQYVYEWLEAARSQVIKVCPFDSEDEEDLGTQDPDVTFLLGHAGRIYLVDRSWTLIDVAATYFAIGLGAPFAMGALTQLANQPEEDAVRTALEVSALFCPSVAAPFYVLKK